MLITSDPSVKCSHCNKVIEFNSYIFLHKSYSRRDYVKKVYCIDCIKHHKKRIYDEFFSAQAVPIIPPNSQLVPECEPHLQVSTSVFDSAISNKNINSDTKGDIDVIDRTRIAGKQEYNKLDMCEGKKTDVKKLEENFNSKKQAIEYLDSLK